MELSFQSQGKSTYQAYRLSRTISKWNIFVPWRFHLSNIYCGLAQASDPKYWCYQQIGKALVSLISFICCSYKLRIEKGPTVTPGGTYVVLHTVVAANNAEVDSK